MRNVHGGDMPGIAEMQDIAINLSSSNHRLLHSLHGNFPREDKNVLGMTREKRKIQHCLDFAFPHPVEVSRLNEIVNPRTRNQFELSPWEHQSLYFRPCAIHEIRKEIRRRF